MFVFPPDVHSLIIQLMKQVLAPIVSCTEAMPGSYLIWVEAMEIAAGARSGQFVTIRCGEDVLLRRPLSIHRTDGGKLALLFAIVGQGTEWLSKRTAGESLDILGPLGNGFKIHQGSQRLLLLAGGIGVAPLVTLAEKAVADGLSVRFVLGAATSSQLYPQDLVTRGIELTRVTEDGSAGEKGIVTDLLPPLAGWADQVFACGPIPMYRAMAGMLGDKPAQVLLEQVMGCGVGACRGCGVPTNQGIKLVCQDGPVFDLRRINWEEVREPGLSRLKESA